MAKYIVTEDPKVKFDEAAGTAVMELVRPIERKKGDPITSLTFHSPTVADLEAGDDAKGPIGKLRLMLAAMADISPIHISAMGPLDFDRAQAVVNYLGGEKKPEADQGGDDE